MGCRALLCVMGKLADGPDNEVNIFEKRIESEPGEADG
jgi:hypothetical protein